MKAPAVKTKSKKIKSEDMKKILSTKESLWSSFSGSLKKYIGKLNTINSIRGLRYFGPSKMLSLIHI